MTDKISNVKMQNNIFFGKDALEHLPKAIEGLSPSKVLIVYGEGSAKDNGIIKKVRSILKDLGIKSEIHDNVKTNTIGSHINEGVGIAIYHKIDLIIGIGGGSAIDEAKAIGICAGNKCDNISQMISDHIAKKLEFPLPSIPVIAVSTTASTGSEVNNWMSMLCNRSLQKVMIKHPSIKPVATICDPAHTLTLSQWETSAGAFTIFSRILEQFYSKDLFDWTREYFIAQMKIVMKHARILMEDPKNIDSRTNLMWCSIAALNPVTKVNGTEPSFDVGKINLGITAMRHLTTGAVAAMLTPKWLKEMQYKADFRERTVLLGQGLFGVDSPEDTIDLINQFIVDLKLPTCVAEFKKCKKFGKDDLNFIAERVLRGRQTYGTWEMTAKNITSIVEACQK